MLLSSSLMSYVSKVNVQNEVVIGTSVYGDSNILGNKMLCTRGKCNGLIFSQPDV